MSEIEHTDAGELLRISRRNLLSLGGALLLDATISEDESSKTYASTTISGGATASKLRCEYRTNPLGIDVTAPRLSWIVSGPRRGERQTAYQAIVSSSLAALNSGHGDLWDSGRVTSSRTNQVVYKGRRLASRSNCYWKVRVWDKDGTPSNWSETALWTIGLLQPSDWQAEWISDPILADPANRPRTPIHCYLSEISHSPNTEKSILVDLGQTASFDGVRFTPARPENTNPDIRTTLYPLRFKVEVSLSIDFSASTTVVDQTAADVNSPRTNGGATQVYRFNQVSGRYVRLVVTRLSLWDGNDYALGLGRFQVFNGGDDIAEGRQALCSDSVETDQWSAKFLTDPHASIVYCSMPPVLAPKMGGIDSVSRVPMLRREFNSNGAVARATLYCAGLGFYEISLNGKRVTDDLLCGGYTEYNKRVQYQTYDVTEHIQRGPNAMGLLLGYGWYAGHMNLSGNEYFHGFFPQVLGQLEIEYNDGKTELIATDKQWKSTIDGPYRWSDILAGDGYDCRKERKGWDKPGFSDAEWRSAAAFPKGKLPLVWQRAQPVRRMEELQPIDVKEVSPGVYVFDMGQEMSGWCRVTLDGPTGTFVKLRHAEQRNPDGTLNTSNLWDTAAEEDYILDGAGPRVFEPHFTWHGFRFVELSGLVTPPTKDTVVGIHVRSGANQIGLFDSSNALYNKLMSASRWTQQNMMFDVPAGCAGRSERLAWTGDIRPCVQTAQYHFDSTAFFEKYAADLRTDQTDEGRFTDICPHAHLEGTSICVGSPGWADAGVSLPWTVYLNTGDTRVLSDHYEAARRWVDFISGNNPDFIWSKQLGMAWGDWLSAGPATPMQIGATVFFAQDADILSRMAEILGLNDDALRYRTLFKNIQTAFAGRFVSLQGIIQPGSSVDVTVQLQKMVTNQRLQLTVNNPAMGGDPAPNLVKSLSVSYKIGDAQQTQSFAEDSLVDINGAGQALTILRAIYGPGGADLSVRHDVEGSYALALHFGLLDESIRSAAVDRLTELIARNGGRTTTGFWSSVELLMALSDNGRHEAAAQLMNLTTAPSWGYMVQGDGSTCWESFDADTHGLSLNHWTHSAIAEWMWRNVAGVALDPAKPGWKSVIIRPRPAIETSSCKSSYESLNGVVKVSWEKGPADFTLDAVIPANMSAIVYIPAAAGASVTEGGTPAVYSSGVRFLRREQDCFVYNILSGSYNFVSA